MIFTIIRRSPRSHTVSICIVLIKAGNREGEVRACNHREIRRKRKREGVGEIKRERGVTETRGLARTRKVFQDEKEQVERERKVEGRDGRERIRERERENETDVEPERSRRLEGKKVGHEARNETATGRKAGETTREENARLRSAVGTSRKRARFVNTRAPRRAKLSSWPEVYC